PSISTPNADQAVPTVGGSGQVEAIESGDETVRQPRGDGRARQGDCEYQSGGPVIQLNDSIGTGLGAQQVPGGGESVPKCRCAPTMNAAIRAIAQSTPSNIMTRNIATPAGLRRIVSGF